MEDLNPYDALGVSPSATADEIEKAGRRHARKHHPDRDGDRAAFDQGRRALTVLRDPKKRATFDATGQIDDAPENAVFSQAISTLTQKLGAVLANSSLNPDLVDITAHIRKQLMDDKAALRSNKAGHERQIQRLEKFGRRLKLKAGVEKENLLSATVHAQIAGHRQVIAQASLQLEVAEFAETILADYAYELDVKEPHMPGHTVLTASVLKSLWDEI